MMRFALVLLAALAAIPARAGVDIKEVTTPGGIDAWLVEDHSIPFVALEIRFRGGASLDAPDAQGATNLMVGLLEEGAADMTAQEFAKARDALNPGGVLAIWSAAPDHKFTRRLKDAGFAVEAREVRARPGGKGPRHTIWFAKKG